MAGSVFDLSVLNGVNGPVYNPFVAGNGRLCKTFPCIDHNSDAVVGASAYKIGGDPFEGFQAVGFQIFCQHTSRNIDRHDDVDSLIGFGAFANRHIARPRQSDKQHREG
jgi:hypothetical protein